MSAKLIGGGIVAVVAVAAGIYFGVLDNGSGSGDAAAAKERAEKFISSVKDKGGEVTYKTADAPGRGLVLKDVAIVQKDASGKPVQITVDEMRITAFDWDNPKQPAFATLEYKGIRIPAVKDTEQFKEFASVTGLRDLVINAKAAYKYDKATKTIDLTAGDFEVEGMGTLSITAKFDGIDIAQLEGLRDGGDPTKALGAIAAVRIHGLKIAFKDSGATAKVIKMDASKSKISEDEVRKKALDAVAQGKSAPFKIAKDAANAVETFIKSPGTITIEAKPATPFALAQTMSLMGKPDPAAIDKLTADLGLSVSAR